MTTSLVYSFQYGSSLISSQNDEYFISSIFLNNSDFTQVLIGDDIQVQIIFQPFIII